MTDLFDVFMRRAVEISDAIKLHSRSTQPAGSPSPLGSHGAYASALFRSIMGLDDFDVGSWVAGIPLTILLSARRRLTVDIAPTFLIDIRKNYGISEKAIISLAKDRMILLNIRDFDPHSPDARSQADAYEPFASFISKIFDVAAYSTYFVAILRDQIFDTVAAASGKKSLRAYFEDANVLEPASQTAGKPSVETEIIKKQKFRGESAPFAATRWHWAYISTVADSIDFDTVETLKLHFGRCTDTTAAPVIVAQAYNELANMLRYNHLLHSAPLSAAFRRCVQHSPAPRIRIFALDRARWQLARL